MGHTLTQNELSQHFSPGNIIFLDYWSAYDRVIEFNWNGGDWWVRVEDVKKHGDRWVSAGAPRIHGTYPHAGDRLVDKAVL